MHLLQIAHAIPAFLFVLGVTVFIHEFGHFITAKAFGIRVFVFSFGFGQRLLGFKWGDTDCRLSLIPLGGYVKLEGEEDDRLSEDTKTLGDGRDFTMRPRWQRIVVYVAGPVMNVVLTIGVLSGLYMHGAYVDATLFDRAIIGAVEPGSPEEKAGLAPGDEIVAIEGKPQETWQDARLAIAVRPGQLLNLRVQHGGAVRDVAVTTRTGAEGVGEIGVYPLVRVGEVTADGAAAQAGVRADDAILRLDGKAIHAFEDIPAIVHEAADRPLHAEVYREGATMAFDMTPRAGKIGITNKRVYRKFGLPGAVAEASRQTVFIARQTVDMLSQVVTARVSPKVALSGPVGIFKEAGRAAESGLEAIVFLLAIISLSVGVLNLFPLPPLDGGHLAILVVEGTMRRDLSFQAKAWIMNAGAAVLMLLIVVVLYFDVTK